MEGRRGNNRIEGREGSQYFNNAGEKIFYSKHSGAPQLFTG